jgi:hypothetical protein
MVNSNPKKRK